MTANHALLFGWNRPITGKETIASELFGSWVSFWTQQKTKGTIESFEPVLISEHGGDFNGFFLVKGERNTLQKIRWENEEYRKLNLQTSVVMQGWGVQDCYVGDELQKIMGEWTQLVTRK